MPHSDYTTARQATQRLVWPHNGQIEKIKNNGYIDQRMTKPQLHRPKNHQIDQRTTRYNKQQLVSPNKTRQTKQRLERPNYDQIDQTTTRQTKQRQDRPNNKYIIQDTQQPQIDQTTTKQTKKQTRQTKQRLYSLGHTMTRKTKQ